MDPLSLIVAALVAGASAAMKDSAGDAVKTAYAGLKSLLKRKFGGNAFAESVLDKHEENPATWAEPLRDQLVEAGAPDDEQIVAAAAALLERADPHGAQVGKYNVQISGGQGTVIGDNANVTQTFNGQ